MTIAHNKAKRVPIEMELIVLATPLDAFVLEVELPEEFFEELEEAVPVGVAEESPPEVCFSESSAPLVTKVAASVKLPETVVVVAVK